jgi:hypothetical protein
MFAQFFVTGTWIVVFALMVVISTTGTITLARLIIDLLHPEQRLPKARPTQLAWDGDDA